MASFLTGYRQASIWDRRGAAAFALAPLAPALVYGLFTADNFLGATAMSALIAYGHMLFLGLPLAAWVNWRRKISLLTSALGAASVGMLPWLVFMIWSVLHSRAPMGSNAIIAMFFSFGFFGSMGFIAGVTWWFIATPRRSAVSLNAAAT